MPYYRIITDHNSIVIACLCLYFMSLECRFYVVIMSLAKIIYYYITANYIVFMSLCH